MYQEIVENARTATGASLVHFAWIEDGRVRTGAMAGTGAGTAERALAVVRAVLPEFDPFALSFAVDATPLGRRVLVEGETILSTFAELAGGVVPAIVLESAAGIAGLRHSLSCPLRVGGRIVGSLTFHHSEPLSPAQRVTGEAFARQATLTLELAREIAERRQMEEHLLRAQRLETAGKIAGQVAHDFNNMLAPLVGYPELIKMRLPADHPAVPLCDALQTAAEQVAAINQDLLALGRRGHAAQEPLELNRVVRECLADMPPIPDTLAIQLVLSDELMPVIGSALQLTRVVSNLVTNAREAMEDIGELTIRTENVYLDRPLAQYSRIERGEYVRLDVVDSGPGISAEIADRIFDAFFTTKRPPVRRGTGLGLSVVQSVVDDHRGYVDLSSEPGRGTRVSAYLPICRDEIPRARHDDAPRGGTESILVVDDDQVQREVAGEMLRALGYRVTVANSGEDAIATLCEQPHDLLLLDMVMPGGIDGAETYRRALDVRVRQRAIILSGFAESGRVEEAQRLGAGAFVRKPVTLERLARAVREELDRVDG